VFRLKGTIEKLAMKCPIISGQMEDSGSGLVEYATKEYMSRLNALECAKSGFIKVVGFCLLFKGMYRV